MRTYRTTAPSLDAQVSRLAGRLFVPVLALMALAFAYTLATTVSGAVRGQVASAIAADSTGLIR